MCMFTNPSRFSLPLSFFLSLSLSPHSFSLLSLSPHSLSISLSLSFSPLSPLSFSLPLSFSPLSLFLSFSSLSLSFSFSLSLSLLLLYEVWTTNTKWLLIVDGDFFLFLSCQHPGNFVPTDLPRPSKEVLGGLCHSLSVDLSNTAWAQAGLINELSENVIL